VQIFKELSGSHGGGYEGFYLPELKRYQRFGGSCCLYLQLRRIADWSSVEIIVTENHRYNLKSAVAEQSINLGHCAQLKSISILSTASIGICSH
jgi:hypothetical protein